MSISIDQNEKKLLERLLRRGGATLVVKQGGEVKITTYYNTAPLRDCRIRHG
ncbi:hypothetical protein [Mangrovicoccus sp. HB161399]|uniref:hypothetical protein n=1 Tax=Mangrovicoccus sp. HB161399 TaxID=2720392 RepID=UPI001555AA86|nr:hypothetical protein [Mangrovicoccus sp. HB161399]